MSVKYDKFDKIPKPAKQIFHIDPERHNPDTVSDAPKPDATYVSHHVLFRLWELYLSILMCQAYNYYQQKKAEAGIHITLDLTQVLGPIPDYVIDIKGTKYTRGYVRENIELIKRLDYGNTSVIPIETTDTRYVEQYNVPNNICKKQEYDKLIACYMQMYSRNIDAFFGIWQYANVVVYKSLSHWYMYYLLRESQTDMSIKTKLRTYQKTFDSVYRDVINTVQRITTDTAITLSLSTQALYDWHTQLLDSMYTVLDRFDMLLIFV